MERIEWSGLLNDSVKERAIEQWLWNADIAAELSSGSADVNLISSSLFGCLSEYPKSKDIQSRCYQLLQDIQMHNADRMEAVEESSRFMIIVENSLRNWTSHADIVSGCFHYIAAISAHASSGDGGNTSNHLLEAVFPALTTHCHSKRVQLPGLQILSNILQQSITNSITITDDTLRIMVAHLIYNLRFQNDDLSIIKICCSSLEMVMRKTAPVSIAKFIDDIAVLVSEIFHHHHNRPEVVSDCLLIIEKLAVDESKLLVFCSSPIQLLQICDSIKAVKLDSRYHRSVVAACHILNQAATNQSILSCVLDEDKESRHIFLSKLQSCLVEILGDIGERCGEFNLIPSLQHRLLVSVDGLFTAVEDLILVPTSCTATPGRYPEPDTAEHSDFDSDSIILKPGKPLIHVHCAQPRHRNGSNGNSPEKSFQSANIRSARMSFTEGEVGSGSDCSLGEADQNKHLLLANMNSAGFLQIKDSSDATETAYESHVHDTLQDKQREVSKISTCLNPPTTQETTAIIEVAQVSQHQAAVAMDRADILHRLFVEATKKMEELMRESDELRSEIDILKSSLEEDDVDLDTQDAAEETVEYQEGIQPEDVELDGERSAATAAAVRSKLQIELNKICIVDKGNVERGAHNGVKSDDDNDRAGALNKIRRSVMMFESGSDDEDTGLSNTAYSSLSVTQEWGVEDGGGSGGDRGVQGLHSIGLLSPHGDQKNDWQVPLAVAGFLEALTVLTCVNCAQTRYEAALTDKVRRSILQHGRGVMTNAEWEKYEVIGGCYYVGRQPLSAGPLEALARLAVRVFQHLKDYEMTGTTALLKMSALSFATLRILVRGLPVFQMRDLDILISRLGVPYLSLSGFCFALMALAVKRFKKADLELLVAKLSELLRQYVEKPEHNTEEITEFQSTNPGEESEQLSAEDMASLVLSFDRGRSALQSIFNSYIEAPQYQTTVSKLDRRGHLLKMTTSPCKVSSDHAFVESPCMRIKLDSSLPPSSVQYGVTLMGVSQFAMDFDLHPTILAPSLLFKIFQDVLAGDNTRPVQEPEPEQFSPLGRYLGLSKGEMYSPQSRSKAPPPTPAPPHTMRHTHPSVTLRPAGASPGTLGEPLLTLDQVPFTLSTSFTEEDIDLSPDPPNTYFHVLYEMLSTQFQAVIVGVAMRSSYLQELAHDKQHAEELTSPPLMRRLFLNRDEDKGQSLKIAIKKLNCLLTWMNESRGRDRLAERLRSVSSSALTFKPVT